jgi:hypothetical protein
VKSPLVALFVVLAITAIAASAAPAPTPSKWQLHEQELFRNSAPADEYFGRLKISYLGMNNTFRDSAISAGDHTTDAGIAGKVALAEDALEDWARKYPRDPQLARTYFLALQIERKLWLKPDQDRAWVVLNRLGHDFPATYFGKLARRALAIGFTEHYYALPVACATPSPTPSPSPSASDQETAAALASPLPSPAPTIAPTATPTPGPLETTLGRGLRAEILPQPCVPAPTPSPTASPSPSPPPSPTPSPSAAASDVPSPAAT